MAVLADLKLLVCGRSIAAIAGSNLADGMGVRLLFVVCLQVVTLFMGVILRVSVWYSVGNPDVGG